MDNKQGFKSLIKTINALLEEGDLEKLGTKVSEGAVDRYTVVNLTADTLFDYIKDITIQPLKDNKSYLQTSILCEGFYFTPEKKKQFMDFLDMVDDFSISPIDPTTVHISYSIADVWEEGE